jgi:hypothetical protein
MEKNGPALPQELSHTHLNTALVREYRAFFQSVNLCILANGITEVRQQSKYISSWCYWKASRFANDRMCLCDAKSDLARLMYFFPTSQQEQHR